MDPTTISAIIACLGGFVGAAGLARLLGHDAKDAGADMTRISTTLDFVANDVKETKTEVRAMRNDMQEAKTTASMALDRAEAAHARLDALGAPSAHRSKGEEQ